MVALGSLEKCEDCKHRIRVQKPNGEEIWDCGYANLHMSGCADDEERPETSDIIRHSLMVGWFNNSGSCMLKDLQALGIKEKGE